MNNRPIFVYSGTEDKIVENSIVKKTKSQFEDFFGADVKFVESNGGHVFPTTLPTVQKSDICSDAGPFGKYRNCNIDLVGQMLTHILPNHQI